MLRLHLVMLTTQNLNCAWTWTSSALWFIITKLKKSLKLRSFSCKDILFACPARKCSTLRSASLVMIGADKSQAHLVAANEPVRPTRISEEDFFFMNAPYDNDRRRSRRPCCCEHMQCLSSGFKWFRRFPERTLTCINIHFSAESQLKIRRPRSVPDNGRPSHSACHDFNQIFNHRQSRPPSRIQGIGEAVAINYSRERNKKYV